MTKCSAVQGLPEGFGQLTQPLQELDLRGCTALEGLPEGFGGLSMLRILDLRGCSSLWDLPASFALLSSLGTVRVHTNDNTSKGCTNAPVTVAAAAKIMLPWSRAMFYGLDAQLFHFFPEDGMVQPPWPWCLD